MDRTASYQDIPTNGAAASRAAARERVLQLQGEIESALRSTAEGPCEIEFRESPQGPSGAWRRSAIAASAAVLCAGAMLLAATSQREGVQHESASESASAIAPAMPTQAGQARAAIPQRTPSPQPAPAVRIIPHIDAALDQDQVKKWARLIRAQPKLLGGFAPAELALAAASPIVRAPLPSVTVSLGGAKVQTLHPMDRVTLCKEIAQEIGLAKVGRDWRDIYAIVHAETGWVPRDGMGRNGKVSRGLAQLEDATAAGLGISDPHDPRQALRATAMLIKDSTGWASRRGVELKDEAVSVFYNLSTKARNAWDGKSLEDLPIETQRHVSNVADGKKWATNLGQQHDRFIAARVRDAAMLARSDSASSAQPGAAKDAAPGVERKSMVVASAGQERSGNGLRPHRDDARSEPAVAERLGLKLRNLFLAAVTARVDEQEQSRLRERQRGS